MRRGRGRRRLGLAALLVVAGAAGCGYEHAGRLIGDPLPNQPTTGPASGFGGTPRANAGADADLWPRILRFFADRLGS